MKTNAKMKHILINIAIVAFVLMGGVVWSLVRIILDIEPAPACPKVEKEILYNVSFQCERDAYVENMNHEAIPLARELLREAYQQGLNVLFFEGKRGLCRQQRLYEKGTTRRLHSEHLLGNAFDIVFLDEDGKTTWKSEKWEELGKIGKDLGLLWGGDFEFYDPTHFEIKSERYYDLDHQ